MAAKKKSSPKPKAKAKAAPKVYTGPAVAIEEGTRVEGAKRGEPVANADAATGKPIDAEGAIKAQKVGA